MAQVWEALITQHLHRQILFLLAPPVAQILEMPEVLVVVLVAALGAALEVILHVAAVAVVVAALSLCGEALNEKSTY